jgi:hypothetical protein
MKKLIILSLLLVGCGSRKVIVDKQETKTQTEAKTEIKIVDRTKLIDTTVIDELEIIPIDTLKPIVIDGKTYFNAKIKHVKTKKHISIQSDIKSEVKHVKSESKKVAIKHKEIEKTFSYWWLLLLIPIYYVYRKYKSYLM